VRDSYETALNDELDDLMEQVKELATLCKATGAKDYHALQDSLMAKTKKHMLDIKKAREVADPKCKTSETGTTTPLSIPALPKLKARLPQLELPSFDGDPLNW